MCLHFASFKFTARHKIGLSLSSFLSFTGWFSILPQAFRNDHLAALSTALRWAREENEIGGNVNVPCSSKMTQRSSTADWINVW